MARDEKISHLLSHNVETVIERAHLERALRSGKKLRVKHGIDPTGEKIHLGRAISLWKLREFQELGHKVVLIIGDFTAQIGDPSDKLEKRPFLTAAQIQRNLKNYLPQVGKIVNLKKAEVRYNSEWLSKLSFREVSELAELFSAAQMLERRNFKERWEKKQEISLREFMYPLMQGYDSVAVKADVEIGGSDQLFNLLAGRKIQEHYGQKPQDVLTTKMLLGLDGRKMSTSWGNVINIIDSPDEQCGKIMSMHDDLIVEYFRLATGLSDEEVKDEKRFKYPNPRDAKMELARQIVARYHGTVAAAKAAEKFNQLFATRQRSITAVARIIPRDLPELKLVSKTTASEAVFTSGVVKSRSEARRLIRQGGFDVDGVVKSDPRETLTLRGGEMLKIGKKSFFRVKV